MSTKNNVMPSVCVCVCVWYFEQWIVSFIQSISIIPYVTSIMANSVDPDKTLQIVAYVQSL